MTKKEMLQEMLECSESKASLETVTKWYQEWLRIKANPNKVRSVKEWKSWVRYIIKAK